MQTILNDRISELSPNPTTLLSSNVTWEASWRNKRGQKRTLIEHYIHTVITTRLRPLTELRVHLTHNSNYKGEETE